MSDELEEQRWTVVHICIHRNDDDEAVLRMTGLTNSPGGVGCFTRYRGWA